MEVEAEVQIGMTQGEAYRKNQEPWCGKDVNICKITVDI
jgi:hypothetical protein